MKILLVNPPRSPHNAIFDRAPAAARRFIHRKLVGPPLGLLTLAAAAPDHDVRLLDLKGEYDLDPEAPKPEALLRRDLEQFRPDVVGATFIASEFPAGMALLRAAKGLDPRVTTFAGGLHATLCPQDFDDPAVDVVFSGAANRSFPRALEALERRRPLETVGGIWIRRDGRLVPSPAPAEPCDPAGADFLRPRRDLVRPWLSTYVVGRAAGPSTYLFTSLGCPFRCTFCSIWGQWDGHYARRRVESIVEELGTLDEYEVVRFADANTLVDLGFIERLFDRIAEEGIRKTFIMDIRADTAAAHPRLIEKLARGGLKVAIVGFESFRRAELERYDKRSDPDLIPRAIEVFHRNGILLRGNYIVPPDYTARDFEEVAEYAVRNRVHFAGYTILTPMPGSPLHAEVLPRIVDHDLAKYNFFNCVLETALPLDEFYERVGRLWLIREGEETI